MHALQRIFRGEEVSGYFKRVLPRSYLIFQAYNVELVASPCLAKELRYESHRVAIRRFSFRIYFARGQETWEPTHAGNAYFKGKQPLFKIMEQQFIVE